MSGLTLAVKRLPHGEGLSLPSYATEGSAGLDIAAAVTAPVTIAPGGRALIPSGFSIALPPGYEAQVRPRSGLALKHGLTLLNTPGTIDSDYRGEVAILMINLGEAPVEITRGMRIAQLVVAPVSRVALKEAETLPESARGAGGFGSTGTGPTRSPVNNPEPVNNYGAAPGMALPGGLTKMGGER